MKPSQRLGEIERLKDLMDVHDLQRNLEWLLARVYQLTDALEKIKNHEELYTQPSKSAKWANAALESQPPTERKDK